MTNTESFQPNHLAAVLSVLAVVAIVLLGVLGWTGLAVASAPATAVSVPVDPGVRVDLNYERTDVVSCLLDLGYQRVGTHLVVTRADLDACRARLA